MKHLSALIVAAALCFPSIGAWAAAAPNSEAHGIAVAQIAATDTELFQLKNARVLHGDQEVQQAWWQSIQQVGISASAPPVATFIASNGNPSSGSGTATYTWNAVNLGNPAYITTRRVICVFTNPSLASPASISSATINGVTATVHTFIHGGGGGDVSVGIFSAVVPSGTTGISVVVNWPGATFGVSMPLLTYMVDNSLLLSTTPNTGSGGIGASTSVATSAFTAISGGFVIGGAAINAANTAFAATGYTTDGFGGTATQLNFSDLTGAKAGSITPTAAWGSSATNAAIAATAWR